MKFFGASTAAAFKVCLHMVDDEEGYIAKEFLKGFRENWKQGTVLGIISLYDLYDSGHVVSDFPDHRKGTGNCCGEGESVGRIITINIRSNKIEK